MKKLSILIVVMIMGLISHSQRVEIGGKVPDMTFYTPEGKKFNLYSSKKPLVLIDFWSTGCSSCIEKFPYIKKKQEQYSKELDILVVNSDEKKYLDRLLKTKPGILKSTDNQFINDKVGEQTFPHGSVPHYVWISMNDKKVHAITGGGEVKDENIAKFISQRSIVLPLKKDILYDQLMENDEPIQKVNYYIKFKWDTIAGVGRERNGKTEWFPEGGESRGYSYRNYKFGDLVLEMLPWNNTGGVNLGAEASKRIYGYQINLDEGCCFEFCLPLAFMKRQPYTYIRDKGWELLQETSMTKITFTREARPVWVLDLEPTAKLKPVKEYEDTVHLHTGKLRNAKMATLAAYFDRMPMFGNTPVINEAFSTDGIDMDLPPVLMPGMDVAMYKGTIQTVEALQKALAKYGVRLYGAVRTIDMVRVQREF